MQLETNDITKKFPRNPSREQRRLHHRAKLAVRDPFIASRELAKQQEKYTIQDPGSASQELANGKKHMQQEILKQPNTKTGKKEQKRLSNL
jgi:hypothetical protein